MRKTSWCTGDVAWYIKGNGKFVRYPLRTQQLAQSIILHYKQIINLDKIQRIYTPLSY